MNKNEFSQKDLGRKKNKKTLWSSTMKKKFLVIVFILILSSILTAILGKNFIFVFVFLFCSILFLISYYFPEITFPVLLIPTKFTEISKALSLPPSFNPVLLLLGIILITILIRILKTKDLPKIPSRILILYSLLALWMLSSLLWTPEAIYGQKKLLEFVTLTGFSCFAPFFLFRDILALKRFFIILTAGGIFLAFLFFIFYLPWFSPLIKSPLILQRLSPLYPYCVFGSNYLALQQIFGMACLVILVYFFSKNQSRKQKFLYIFVSTVLITALIYAGGKSIPLYFFSIIIFTIIVVMTKKLESSKTVFHLLVPVIFIVLVLILIFPRFIYSFLARFRVLLLPMGYAQIERLQNAEIALSLFYHHPLLGVGIGGFRKYSFNIPGIERFKYPHNIFLETLSELGIIGFILLILILSFGIKQFLYFLKRYKNSELVYLPLLIFSLFIFSLLISQSSGDINNHSLFAWIGTLYAIEKTLGQN